MSLMAYSKSRMDCSILLGDNTPHPGSRVIT